MALTPERAAEAFLGAAATCEPLGGGHINASYVVRCGGERRFLQRINGVVFPDARRVMMNVAAVTAHVRSVAGPVSVPGLVATLDGRPWLEEGDECWRCAEFADGIAHAHLADPRDAREVAYAFGEFSRAMASYDGPQLTETIKGFHDTAARVRQLELSVEADAAGRLQEARSDVEELLVRRELAECLPPKQDCGAVPRRLAHNDAKASNVLFDRVTGRARWVVDLDTVMPGSLLHDFGDLVRSSVANAAEDAVVQSAKPGRFAALADGFLQGVGDTITPAELELLEPAGRIITYEQAIRFLADHLRGDRYYRIAYPGQNLVRARAQLALLRSLEEQAATFQRLIELAAA